MKDSVFAFVLALAIVLAISFVAALPIMWVWNWLIPAKFNGPELGFFETVGLVFLVKSIFPSSVVERVKSEVTSERKGN